MLSESVLSVRKELFPQNKTAVSGHAESKYTKESTTDRCRYGTNIAVI